MITNYPLEQTINSFLEHIFEETVPTSEEEAQAFLKKYTRQFKPEYMPANDWNFTVYILYHDEKKKNGLQKGLEKAIETSCRAFFNRLEITQEYFTQKEETIGNIERNINNYLREEKIPQLLTDLAKKYSLREEKLSEVFLYHYCHELQEGNNKKIAEKSGARASYHYALQHKIISSF
jgi:hypothetical protein